TGGRTGMAAGPAEHGFPAQYVDLPWQRRLWHIDIRLCFAMSDQYGCRGHAEIYRGAMTSQSVAAEQAVAPETEAPERKSIVDDFAGYRALRRRIADLENSGLHVPFFAPRDGVSHSVIRRGGQSLLSFSGYNYLGLNGHPAVTAAA